MIPTRDDFNEVLALLARENDPLAPVVDTLTDKIKSGATVGQAEIELYKARCVQIRTELIAALDNTNAAPWYSKEPAIQRAWGSDRVSWKRRSKRGKITSGPDYGAYIIALARGPTDNEIIYNISPEVRMRLKERGRMAQHIRYAQLPDSRAAEVKRYLLRLLPTQGFWVFEPTMRHLRDYFYADRPTELRTPYERILKSIAHLDSLEDALDDLAVTPGYRDPPLSSISSGRYFDRLRSRLTDESAYYFRSYTVGQRKDAYAKERALVYDLWCSHRGGAAMLSKFMEVEGIAHPLDKRTIERYLKEWMAPRPTENSPKASGS